MNRRQIALKLVLNELGMDPSLDSFDERLVLQKTIYLVQNLGISLGYHFSWYIRGPYSRDLTADAFANLGSSIPEGWLLSDLQKAKLAEAKAFLDAAPAGRPKPRELEKLASVLFVVKTGQESSHDIDGITSRMSAAGKDFSREEVDDAIRILREQRLLPQA